MGGHDWNPFPSIILVTIATVSCAQLASRTGMSKSEAESIIRRVPTRVLCSISWDAPSRRPNYLAAYEKHKKTIESISKLDWRKDTITSSQVDALNDAKFQINRAELIDLAIALREDFRPPSGRRVATAYAEHAPLIERVAADDWRISAIGEAESEKLSTAGRVLLAASQMDLADTLAGGDASAHVRTALLKHGQDVKQLAAKEWRSESPTDNESKALGAVMDAHLMDLAVAFGRIAVLGTTDSVRSAYQEHQPILQRLASKQSGDEVTAEEKSAVCAVLSKF